MPVIGMYAVAIVFVLWYSFVYVMGQYHVGGMSQQWYSYVMAGLASVVFMWYAWLHSLISASAETLMLIIGWKCSRAGALTDSYQNVSGFPAGYICIATDQRGYTLSLHFFWCLSV